jgi:hypothetical protein
MIQTVDDFCELVRDDIEGLVRELTLETGRGGPKEQQSWRNSLPPLSEALGRATAPHPGLGGVHLGLGHLALEYRLPGVNSWCDAVLLGDSPSGRAHALIIELKHWDTNGDLPGDRETLIR